ncbi:molybdenum cofactor guanylyltransferase [Halomarina litorea]|uniref:molybdenum cofactor guanylyltransferase n=1 Tax=Halomarina litorea TaxID=2961595 RepID=UPI0020C1BFF6|nr:molybdenum cofactor guanylyltransferase [Halomarina sp. BCD28]
MPTGVIVAGGRSTRFGEADKAVASLGGTPMVRHVADRLASVVDSLVVNCRADQRGRIEDALDGYPLPVRFAVDEATDEGPMAGIGTGLRAVESEYAVVVACDMPFVDPGVVSYLFERAAGHDAAVPKLDDGWYQTTQAVYRADAMADACEAALAAGEHKILAPLDRLDWVVVGEAGLRERGSLDTFENVNTREELRAAEERLRRR